MSTQATLDNKRWYRLAVSRPWYDLIPDTAHEVMTSGMGKFGSADYACAAITANGGTIIIYIPSIRQITVNMSGISGKLAKAWWYNPVNGKVRFIGTFKTSDSRQFTSASGDWVLVIDNASLNLPPPGTSKDP